METLLIPAPHHLVRGEGVFVLRDDMAITLEDTEPGALLYAQMLRDEILTHTGLRLRILRGKAEAGDLCVRMSPALPGDVYQIELSPGGARVTGGSDEAVLHGVVTLGQWVAAHGASLPCVRIEDAPDLPNRGYYLDCSRGRVPTLDTLKRYADLLCRYKINQWQLYIEHTYLFRHLSEAWRDDTPLEAEEIMELDAYCRARHIELVPSLSSFGHMYEILSTKTCAELCELEGAERVPFSFTDAGEHHTLNVSNPDALGFIERLIEEFGALFTSRKFNVCCDETYDLGRGKSRALAEQEGTHALYVRHVSALCRWLLSRGMEPMFWGDMLWRHPESYREIPEGTVCLNWGYLPDQRENEIRDLANMGATQYACSGVCGWRCLVPLVHNSYQNNQTMCGHAHRYGAIGLLNTDWGDWGHVNQPCLSVPGILYGAAFAWNAEPTPFEEINRAISLQEYGDETGGLMRAFAALSGHEAFGWERAVRYIEGTEKERNEALEGIEAAGIAEANARIAEGLNALYALPPRLSPAAREAVRALSLAARGAALFNDIGLFLLDAPGARQNGARLAEALENWLHAYAKAWRAVSKESQFRRDADIVRRCADMLRGRCGARREI